MTQPPLTCPKPYCAFPSITVGERHGHIWVSCVSCCGRRQDWEAYLNERQGNEG